MLHTLQGLVDYIKAHSEETKNCFVHILSPDAVDLITPIIGPTRQRERILSVGLVQTSFQFGMFHAQENFIVGLQSQFVDTETRDAVLKIAGSVTSEAITVSEDDGITQRAAAKVGIARQATIDLPNPVKLRPYRTFTEIDQPESLFVFRMRAGVPPSLALFEADGGAWRNKAIANIAYWLTGALKDIGTKIIA